MYRRWEIPIDAVFLDGKKLANSNEQGDGVSTNIVSALIDTVGIKFLNGLSNLTIYKGKLTHPWTSRCSEQDSPDCLSCIRCEL